MSCTGKKWSFENEVWFCLLFSSLSKFVISICETKLHPYLLSQFYCKLLWCLEWLKPTPEAMQILRKYISPCFFYIRRISHRENLYFAWSYRETRKTVPILNFNAKCKWVKKEKYISQGAFQKLDSCSWRVGGWWHWSLNRSFTSQISILILITYTWNNFICFCYTIKVSCCPHFQTESLTYWLPAQF